MSLTINNLLIKRKNILRDFFENKLKERKNLLKVYKRGRSAKKIII